MPSGDSRPQSESAEGADGARPSGSGAESELSSQVSQSLLAGALSSLPEAIVLSRGTRVLYVNREFTRLFGYTFEEARGRDIVELVVPPSRIGESEILRQAANAEGRSSMETQRQTKSGELVDVSLVIAPLIEAGEHVGLCLSYRDLSNNKAMEARLQHLALHDPLTGLPNRALFLDRLKLAMARRIRRSDQGCAVMFLDLDKFKEINDTLGHESGDRVLTEVANRLTALLRPQDTAARMGGDEFAVLLDHVHTIEDIQVVAERIHKEFQRPFELQSQVRPVGVSIGVALCGKEHKQPADLLRDADFAMYRAKHQGGARYEVFDRYMQIDINAQQARERELRRVLEQREFALWYQPIYRLGEGSLAGFESLLRLRRGDGGFESFRELLALADSAGQFMTIHQETMAASLSQMREWLQLWPGSMFTLSLNLSARQFYHPELLTLVGGALEKTKLDPGRLIFEVPEAAINESPEAAAQILERLTERGVGAAIDNFGSSLAPLNYLLNLPVSQCKLDPQLVASVGENGRPSRVLRAVVSLASSLGLEVVAQGVETVGQLEALRAMGCGLAQGFLFAPAVNAKVAGKMIESGTWQEIERIESTPEVPATLAQPPAPQPSAERPAGTLPPR